MTKTRKLQARAPRYTVELGKDVMTLLTEMCRSSSPPASKKWLAQEAIKQEYARRCAEEKAVKAFDEVLP